MKIKSTAAAAAMMSLLATTPAIAADSSSSTTTPGSYPTSTTGTHTKGKPKHVGNGKGAYTRVAITGENATSADAAALKAVDGTVKGTYAVSHSYKFKAAAYSVEILDSNGTLQRVFEDSSFNVLNVAAVVKHTDSSTSSSSSTTPTASAS